MAKFWCFFIFLLISMNILQINVYLKSKVIKFYRPTEGQKGFERCMSASNFGVAIANNSLCVSITDEDVIFNGSIDINSSITYNNCKIMVVDDTYITVVNSVLTICGSQIFLDASMYIVCMNATIVIQSSSIAGYKCITINGSELCMINNVTSSAPIKISNTRTIGIRNSILNSSSKIIVSKNVIVYVSMENTVFNITDILISGRLKSVNTIINISRCVGDINFISYDRPLYGNISIRIYIDQSNFSSLFIGDLGTAILDIYNSRIGTLYIVIENLTARLRDCVIDGFITTFYSRMNVTIIGSTLGFLHATIVFASGIFIISNNTILGGFITINFYPLYGSDFPHTYMQSINISSNKFVNSFLRLLSVTDDTGFFLSEKEFFSTVIVHDNLFIINETLGGEESTEENVILISMAVGNAFIYNNTFEKKINKDNIAIYISDDYSYFTLSSELHIYHNTIIGFSRPFKIDIPYELELNGKKFTPTKVYLNTIISDEIYIEDSGFIYDWGGYGNYWSCCDVVDADGDGVGDEALWFDGDSVDRFPLVRPHWKYNVSCPILVEESGGGVDVWFIVVVFGVVGVVVFVVVFWWRKYKARSEKIGENTETL